MWHPIVQVVHQDGGLFLVYGIVITWWKRSVCRPLTSSNFLGLHWTLQKEYYKRCPCRFCGPRLTHASACHFRARVICITHAPCELIFLLEIVLQRSIYGTFWRSFLRSFLGSILGTFFKTRSRGRTWSNTRDTVRENAKRSSLHKKWFLAHLAFHRRIAACLCGHSKCNLLLTQACPRMIQHLSSLTERVDGTTCIRQACEAPGVGACYPRKMFNICTLCNWIWNHIDPSEPTQVG